MKTKKRQKICYNCNAEVDLEVIVCPYCGTDMLEEFELKFESEDDLDNRSLSAKQTIASLYPPPYQMQNLNMENTEEEEEKDIEEGEETQSRLPSIMPDIILAFSLNIVGLVLLLFFFSTDGEINLKINNKYLVLLFLFSIPAFLWSYKNLNEE
jgi:hypothetical protein